MGTRHSSTLAERFWAKVKKTESCWLWTGTKVGKGYGELYIPAYDRPKLPSGHRPRIRAAAHRISWQLTNGPIPDGMEVCHNCPGRDNPSCVNPAHLFLGTHRDNMRDAGRKRQVPNGERHPFRKLTDTLVSSLRREYAAGGVTFRALADRLGMSLTAIYNAIIGNHWKHLNPFR